MTRNLKNLIQEKIQILQDVLENVSEETETVDIDGIQLSVERVQYMIKEAKKIAFGEAEKNCNLYFIPLGLVMKDESWRLLQKKILEEVTKEQEPER